MSSLVAPSVPTVVLSVAPAIGNDESAGLRASASANMARPQVSAGMNIKYEGQGELPSIQA
eukprot:407592-Alexandrium_andersonii.AAC.1